MTWPAELQEQQVNEMLLGALAPLEVLYEFEGPCIYTAQTPTGDLVLAYLVEEIEDADLLRYIVATTTRKLVCDLKSGLVSVREALTRGWMWIADLDFCYQPRRVFSVTSEQLPDDALPNAGTMLWSELEPAFSVRLAGPEIREGHIPAQVFSHAGTIAAKALKSVFEYVTKPLTGTAGGRPPEWLRSLYNLPTQRVAYGSLEISFREPDLPSLQQLALSIEGGVPKDTLESYVARGWSLLQFGLEWAANPDRTDLDALDEGERQALLEALNALAPPARGVVEAVELSGSKVGGGALRHRLGRTASKKIRERLTALKRVRDVQLRVYEGRIRELDLDALTFILRDLPDGEPREVTFVLDDEQFLEIAREAHYQEQDIRVAGRSTDGRLWTAVEMGFVSHRGA